MPIFDITFSTPLLAGLQVVAERLALGHLAEQAVAHHLGDRLEGEIGVDRRGAVADEEGEVVHLAGVAALDDEADAGPLLLAYEVVVHRRGEQAATGWGRSSRWRCGPRAR